MSETVARARRGRPGHDRDAVVQAAVALFLRKGYDATSIEDVATSLGVTKSAVYHHVASKEEMLAAALDPALDGLERVVDDASERPGAAVDRLRAVVRGSIEVLVDRQSEVTLLLRVHGNSDTEVEALRRRRRLDHRLAGLVSAAVADGALRRDLEPDLVSRLLFGMVNSLVEWYRRDGELSVDQLADTVAALAFDGLVAP